MRTALVQGQMAGLQLQQAKNEEAGNEAVDAELRDPNAVDKYGINEVGLKRLSSEGFGRQALQYATKRTQAMAQEAQLQASIASRTSAELGIVKQKAELTDSIYTAGSEAVAQLGPNATPQARQDAWSKAVTSKKDEYRKAGTPQENLDAVPNEYAVAQGSLPVIRAINAAADRELSRRKDTAAAKHLEEEAAAIPKRLELEKKGLSLRERSVASLERARGMDLPSEDLDRAEQIDAALISRGYTFPGGASRGSLFRRMGALSKAHPDMTPDEIAENIIDHRLTLTAQTAAERRAGTTVGGITQAVNEMDAIGGRVLFHSAQLPRGALKGYNSVRQFLEDQQSDPTLLALKTDLYELERAAEQMAKTRGGSDMHIRERLEKLFSSAYDDRALRALVLEMRGLGYDIKKSGYKTIREVSKGESEGEAPPGTKPQSADEAAIMKKYGIQ